MIINENNNESITDIDECTTTSPCDATNGECVNNNGSFVCSCKNQFILGAGFSCTGNLYITCLFSTVQLYFL